MSNSLLLDGVKDPLHQPVVELNGGCRHGTGEGGHKMCPSMCRNSYICNLHGTFPCIGGIVRVCGNGVHGVFGETLRSGQLRVTGWSIATRGNPEQDGTEA